MRISAKYKPSAFVIMKRFIFHFKKLLLLIRMKTYLLMLCQKYENGVMARHVSCAYPFSVVAPLLIFLSFNVDRKDAILFQTLEYNRS